MPHTSRNIVQTLREAVAELEVLAATMRESMGAHRLPGSGSYAFRRTTDPLLVPVALEPTRFDVPATFFAEGGPGDKATSFFIVNPNPYYVRLRGSSTKDHKPVTPTTGWLLPPHFARAFSTQYPVSMSAMAVSKPGLTLPKNPTDFAPLEIIYGGGL